MHSLYATFSNYSKDHNDGKPIGLIRAADTRMAGHFIALLRMLRLKAALISAVSSAKFKEEPRGRSFALLIKSEKFWCQLVSILKVVVPALRVLRLADSKLPGMDKLFYYVRLTDKILEERANELSSDDFDLDDDIESLTVLDNNDDGDTEDGVTENEPTSDDDSVDSDKQMDEIEKETLGMRIQRAWNHRREKLVNDYSVAGWMLCPVKEVLEDAKDHTGEHRDAVERVLKKLFKDEWIASGKRVSDLLNNFG